MLEMNWGKGLRRLWMVATALWIISVVAGLPEIAAEGVSAAEVYSQYWYYRFTRPDVVAAALRALDNPCLAREERDTRLNARQEKLAEFKAEAAKHQGQLSASDADLLFSIEDLNKIGPECSAEVAKAKEEMKNITFLPGVAECAWAPEALRSFAYWIFGPPIIVFILGTSLIWAFRGFRARR